MGSFGFSLADRLGAKTHPCSVRGCTRTWLAMAGKGAKLGGRPAADPGDPGSSMCDPCREKLGQLSEVQRPCDRAGCDGTWTWPVAAQLEAWAARKQPPKGLCAACETRLAALSDKEVPCSVPGCQRHAVLTRRAQLIAGAPDVEATPEGLMCGPCENVSHKLKDREVTCGINGCKHKWTWTLAEQMVAFASGLPYEPPLRMCEECQTVFGGLADREVKCRISGCRKTWTWKRAEQLNAAVAGKPAPKAPSRGCDSCHELWKGLKDIERPCRRSTCKRTWTEKRGTQLARLVRGKAEPFPRYCDECQKEIGELEDRQIPCTTEGCEGTWTWSAQAQLAAGVRPPGAAAAEKPAGKKRRREARPPERHCSECTEFLTEAKTIEIACVRCKTPIYWPPESQLQMHLGNWAKPEFCGACKRDVIEAARAAEREVLRQQAIAASPGHTDPDAAAPETAAAAPAPDAAGPASTPPDAT